MQKFFKVRKFQFFFYKNITTFFQKNKIFFLKNIFLKKNYFKLLKRILKNLIKVKILNIYILIYYNYLISKKNKNARMGKGKGGRKY